MEERDVCSRYRVFREFVRSMMDCIHRIDDAWDEPLLDNEGPGLGFSIFPTIDYITGQMARMEGYFECLKQALAAVEFALHKKKAAQNRV